MQCGRVRRSPDPLRMRHAIVGASTREAPNPPPSRMNCTPERNPHREHLRCINRTAVLTGRADGSRAHGKPGAPIEAGTGYSGRRFSDSSRSLVGRPRWPRQRDVTLAMWALARNVWKQFYFGREARLRFSGGPIGHLPRAALCHGVNSGKPRACRCCTCLRSLSRPYGISASNRSAVCNETASRRSLDQADRRQSLAAVRCAGPNSPLP